MGSFSTSYLSKTFYASSDSKLDVFYFLSLTFSSICGVDLVIVLCLLLFNCPVSKSNSLEESEVTC